MLFVYGVIVGLCFMVVVWFRDVWCLVVWMLWLVWFVLVGCNVYTLRIVGVTSL